MPFADCRFIFSDLLSLEKNDKLYLIEKNKWTFSKGCDSMQAEQNFFVGIQDVGVNNEMTNKALLECMTNVTNVHGNLAGQGIKDREISSISWIVVNWKLQVYRRPRLCETICLKTWGHEYSRLQASRDYDIFDEKGCCIARGTSRWAAINIEKGSPVRLTPEIMDPFGCEPEHQNFPDYRFQRAKSLELPVLATSYFQIHKSMIDCNRHVHNPVYLDLAAEVLPDGLDTAHFSHVEVSYKHEIKPEETVKLEYSRDEDKHYVMIKDQSGEEIHARIALYNA